MPHIIVEYSDNLSINVKMLLVGLHEELARDPSVDKVRIKTRAIPLATCVVGEDDQPDEMIHITLRLMPRSDTVRETMAEGLQKVALKAVSEDHPNCAVTAETVELHAHSYCS